MTTTTVELRSTITCPECGLRKEETMPTDACQFFYTCIQCGERLRPKAGDCCVFCSYGSVACPPIQQQLRCCTWGGESSMRHPIREEILTAFVLLAGVAPVSMVSLATLQAMAEKPPDAKAQMQILHAFMSGYTVWILIPLLADSATS